MEINNGVNVEHILYIVQRFLQLAISYFVYLCMQVFTKNIHNHYNNCVAISLGQRNLCRSCLHVIVITPIHRSTQNHPTTTTYERGCVTLSAFELITKSASIISVSLLRSEIKTFMLRDFYYYIKSGYEVHIEAIKKM